MKNELDIGSGDSTIRIGVKRLAHARKLPLPAYQTRGAAGLDLVAALPARKTIALAPGARTLVPTGLVLELPRGVEAQVRPRSGLAVKHGVTVLNSPGTIDSDYRGEVMVLLINLGAETFRIKRGERIAQLVVKRVEQARMVPVKTVGATARGAGGFGSTGRKAKTAAARARTRKRLSARSPARRRSTRR